MYHKINIMSAVEAICGNATTEIEWDWCDLTGMKYPKQSKK